MASDNEASCENDPNFAVICAFLEKFGGSCGLTNIDFLELQEMLENTQEVSQALIDLHIKLLRKARKSVSNERWERAVIKICHGFCTQDAWEIERFGYKKARVSCKLRVLKELLEMQFDFNSKFKTEVNKMTAEELRSLPFGRDKLGHAYWFQTDDNCQIRVYKEDIDEETWSLVAKDRESFISLIAELGGDTDSKLSSESLGNEDSNSLAEKPIMDTGQVESNSSDSLIKKTPTESSEDSEEKKDDIKTDISNDSDETQDKSLKRTNEADDNSDELAQVKRPKISFSDAPEPEVSEAIEEPVLVIEGEGSGEENKVGNPIVGEEIEEEIVYFYGVGNGCDNLTGNHGTSDSGNPTKSEEQTNSASSSSSYLNSINSDLNSSEKTTEVPTKSPFKLGTILDTKTDNKITSPRSPTRKSKWDVETPTGKASDNNSAPKSSVKDLVNKFEQITEEKEGPPKKPMFFFGPGSSAMPFKNSNSTASLMGFGLSRIVSNYENNDESHPSKVEIESSKSTGSDKSLDVAQTADLTTNEELRINLETTGQKEAGQEKSLTVLKRVEGSINLLQSNPDECQEKPSEIVVDETDETQVEMESKSNSSVNECSVVISEQKTTVSNESINTDDSVQTLANSEENEENGLGEKVDQEPVKTCDRQEKSTQKDESVTDQKTTTEEIGSKLHQTKQSDEEATESEVQVCQELPQKADETAESSTKVGKNTDERLEIESEGKSEIEEQKSPVASEEIAEKLEQPEAETTEGKSCKLDDNDDLVDSKSVTPSQDLQTDISNNSAESSDNKVPQEAESIPEVNDRDDNSKNVEDSKAVNREASEEKSEECDTKLCDGEKTDDQSNSLSAKTEKLAEEEVEATTNKEDEISSKRSTRSNKTLADNSEPLAKKLKENKSNATGAENFESEAKPTKKALRKNHEEKEKTISEEKPLDDIDSEEKLEKTNLSSNESSETEGKPAKKSLRNDDKKKPEKSKTASSSENSEGEGKASRKSQRKRPDDDKEPEKKPEMRKRGRNVSPETSNTNPPEESTNEEESEVVQTRRGRPPNKAKLTPCKTKAVPKEEPKKPKLSQEATASEGEDETEKETRVTRRSSRQASSPVDLKKKGKKPGPKSKTQLKETASTPSPQSVLSVNLDCEVIDTGSDVVEVLEKDPLATESDGEAPKPPQKMTLQSLSFDYNDSPAPTPPPITRTLRSLRKRGLESPVNVPETENSGGKKAKLKGKRSVDVQLRKSIEEQKRQQVSSSEDDNKSEKSKASPKKKPSPKGGKKVYNFAKKKGSNKSSAQSSDGETSRNNTPPVKKKKNEANRNIRILKNLGIDPDKIDTEFNTNVRQSRRIAQIKIKEDAERDKKYETVPEKSEKKSSKKSKEEAKAEKRKRKEQAALEEEQESDKDKKKRRKKSKKNRIFDSSHPWRSSSDDSDENECEDEEDIVEYSDHEKREPIQLKSDHEFSPESDLEDDDEDYQPTKRARTARKESDAETEDDYACQKCGKSDHPEFILLCDKCDNGWHCSCLRPALFVIPEGDWFCPPCQHVTLIQKLEQELVVLDKKLAKKEIEDRRKERLAYVGISLNNVLKPKKKREEQHAHDEEQSESDSESSSGSTSETDSDEPIYQLRQRRQAKTYRFNDYDELINSAIQDEMEAVKGAGNQGRGKDISTIINAEKEDELDRKTSQLPDGDLPPESKPPVVPTEADDDAKEPHDPTDPNIKKAGRKKPRKLNSLDISSEDDGSDEDFKGTSSEAEEEDFEDEDNLSDSDDYVGRKRRNAGPLRRSTRARVSRYDADFIDDSSSDTAPRRKKKKSIWDETEESEESEDGWGGRQRKKQQSRKKSKKKKKGYLDDSDLDNYKKKKKPKIKYGLSSDDDDVKGRRTRGKKINYVDALGSDSEDDKCRQSSKKSSDDEYVDNEEDDEEEENVSEQEKPNESTDDENSTNVKVPASFKSKARRIIEDSEDEQEQQEQVPVKLDKKEQVVVKNIVQPPKNEAEKESDLNSSDEKLKSLDEMDEAEIEKMMEDEEYANKQLQLVAMQIEKNKKKQYALPPSVQLIKPPAKNVEETKPKTIEQPLNFAKTPPKAHSLETISKIGGITIKRVQPAAPVVVEKKPEVVEDVEGADSMDEDLIVNSVDNDDLSEPPGVTLPMFSELTLTKVADKSKKPSRAKKSIRDALASMELARQGQKLTEISIIPKKKPQCTTPPSAQEPQPNANIEIAAPPQPFAQTQPAPSVITRMLQSAPQNQQPPKNSYPVGTIRPKQFAMLTERDNDDDEPPRPPPPFIPGGPRAPIFRHMSPNMPGFVRGAPPIPLGMRNPGPQGIPPHLYHPHRSLDPSPSGGGPINIPGRNSPSGAPPPQPPTASSPNVKSEAVPPPPYSRAPRMPQSKQLHAPAHLLHPAARPPIVSQYQIPPPQNYHYGGYPAPPQTTPVSTGEEAFQGSPYPEPYISGERQPNSPSDNSNSKGFEEESGGEFGGLVSYFSSQHEDDLES